MVYSLDINVICIQNESLQNIGLFELSIWMNFVVRLNQLQIHNLFDYFYFFVY